MFATELAGCTFTRVPPWSTVAYARIKIGISDIGDQAHKQHEKARDDKAAHRQIVVIRENSVKNQLTSPLVRKYGLSDNRTRENLCKAKCYHRNDRDQGVAQTVTEDYFLFG